MSREGSHEEDLFSKAIVGFTKEYRDQHWVRCRFGTDPRTCGSTFKKRMSDPEYPVCLRDNKECDARWKE